eukprot:scaffold1740_cov254-Pinguiococcus_pyrenoidosus.AAC.10
MRSAKRARLRVGMSGTRKMTAPLPAISDAPEVAVQSGTTPPVRYNNHSRHPESTAGTDRRSEAL